MTHEKASFAYSTVPECQRLLDRQRAKLFSEKLVTLAPSDRSRVQWVTQHCTRSHECLLRIKGGLLATSAWNAPLAVDILQSRTAGLSEDESHGQAPFP
jgi:hypothetical protein